MRSQVEELRGRVLSLKKLPAPMRYMFAEKTVDMAVAVIEHMAMRLELLEEQVNDLIAADAAKEKSHE